MQWRHYTQPGRFGQPTEIDHADHAGNAVAQAHADQHRDIDPEAAHEAVDQQDSGQDQGGDRQVDGRAELRRATAATGPVDGNREQRQANGGDHRTGDQGREEAHHLGHEGRYQHAEEAGGDGGAKDTAHANAFHTRHGHHAADGGEAGTHHHRHANADRADAERLHHGGNSGDQQVGIDQKGDFFPGQTGGLSDDQRHRNGTSVHQQHMLYTHQDQLQQWQGLSWRRRRDVRLE
ncbi:hypothetical protein D3C76_1157300 [compost metagenome]